MDQNPPDLWVILGGDGSLGGRVGYSGAVGLKLTNSVERLHGLPKIWVFYKFEALFAGDSLVRLKKARNYLRDALRAHESAEAEKLADPAWLIPIRQELDAILQSVNNLIDEVRTVLKRDDR